MYLGRDGTIPFENHHRKDEHVLRMLKMYTCKDQKLAMKADSDIEANASGRMNRLAATWHGILGEHSFAPHFVESSTVSICCTYDMYALSLTN